MSTPEQPPERPPAPKAVDELLASPELAKVAENDEYKRVLDHIPIGIVVSRLAESEQRIAYANAAFEVLGGVSAAEIEGRTWSALDDFRHEDDASLGLGKAILGGEDFLGTFRRESNALPPVLAQAYASRIENEDGTENYRIAALVDVSAQERAERDALESMIREKDLLLKELQHRVKNNLQLITALIRLEARTAQRGGAIDLERLAGRIDSLALLYKTLAANTFEREVDLGPYLGEIATAAVRTHSVTVELDLKVGYCPVSVNVAMPVGLLVNELITNAFKHAFSGRVRGKIALECCRVTDNRVEITLTDDGNGFLPGESWPRPGKLGALILQALRENDKHAEFELNTAPGEGTRVRILVSGAVPRAN